MNFDKYEEKHFERPELLELLLTGEAAGWGQATMPRVMYCPNSIQPYDGGCTEA
jgi:hypothetical protein